MDFIRKANTRDISRISEILVFVKRINFRPIFRNDSYSFGELQVLTVAQGFTDSPEILSHIWVYDDGIVKGFIHVNGTEVCELYVDSFFQGVGIGGRLLDFAITEFGVNHLWAIEKNIRAVAFYKRHGFLPDSCRKFEEGTDEYLIKLIR